MVFVFIFVFGFGLACGLVYSTCCLGPAPGFGLSLISLKRTLGAGFSRGAQIPVSGSRINASHEDKDQGSKQSSLVPYGRLI